MYILLALIGAAVLGIAVHHLLPRRDLRGAALAPLVAVAAAAALYAALTWLGLGEDDVWQWVATLAGALVASLAVTALLTRARAARDAADRRRLGLA